ncbi:hypothetical protein D9619_002159 [Psilocybe cf. subviscida]|uniref:Nephrocystin 3-like N-terminal domain-containing protein n=1 Tax=Psilocybe cf. subviscida TaxID=2480587 RepID=A0A8H5BCM0_9AGAR|nr:hypothetical protein D9619_002159 [Psilocybe cf. subviscida]
MSRPPPGTQARSTVNQLHISFIHNHAGAYLVQSATDNRVLVRRGPVGRGSSPARREVGLDPLARLASETTPQAYHNSETRQSLPRCDLNTCRSWQPIWDDVQLLTRPIGSNEPPADTKPILLLTGHAAGGKSTFLQTVADTYHGTDQLHAGHFYESVPDIEQRTASALLANIAYRCCLSQSDSVRRDILDAIGRNPLIFKLSLNDRFRELIANPIIRQDGERDTPPKASLIVIDSIDRCGREEKELILKLIHLFVTTFKNRFVFIISTRIDPDIRYSIAKLRLLPYITEHALNNLSDQSRDISLYLKQRFAACRRHHPYKQFIPPLWPKESDIEQIVVKCSGQFWLAAIAANYVIDYGADPKSRLETFMEYLGGAPSRWDISPQDYPFHDMDKLFRSTFEPLLYGSTRSDVLDILSFDTLYRVSTRSPGPPVQAMDVILELGWGGAASRLADMSSVINESREAPGRPFTYLVLPHATLRDFLLDPSRAGELHINWETRAPIHIAQCLKSLTIGTLSTLPHILETAMKFFYINQHLVTDVRMDILSHVISFSIPHFYGLIGFPNDDTEKGKLLNNFIMYFLPSFVIFLDRFKHARTALPYSGHRSSYSYQFRRHVKDHFELLQSVATVLYSSDWRLSFKVALAFVRKKTAWPPRNTRMRPNDDDIQHMTLLFKYFDIIPFAQQYQHSLASFSASALHCLMYFSHQAAASQGKRVPASSMFQVLRSWNKQGPNALIDFMWCWKRLPRMCRVMVPQSRHRPRHSTATSSRRNTHLFFAQRAASRSVKKTLSKHRQALRGIHSKKYQFALFCLILFLPRAGQSPKLLRLCATQTFSSKSPAFPNLIRKAQEAMNAYVRRWKDYMFVDT